MPKPFPGFLPYFEAAKMPIEFTNQALDSREVGAVASLLSQATTAETDEAAKQIYEAAAARAEVIFAEARAVAAALDDVAVDLGIKKAAAKK